MFIWRNKQTHEWLAFTEHHTHTGFKIQFTYVLDINQASVAKWLPRQLRYMEHILERLPAKVERVVTIDFDPELQPTSQINLTDANFIAEGLIEVATYLKTGTLTWKAGGLVTQIDTDADEVRVYGDLVLRMK